MMWDCFQQQCLQAMGLPLYQPATQQPLHQAPHGNQHNTQQAALSATLLQALARAARCSPAALPPLPTHIAAQTPAGKRALWPLLRQLRRQHRHEAH